MTPASEAAKPVSLLLIDDDDFDIRQISRVLKELGATNPLTVAHDGVEALEVLRGQVAGKQISAPYLILLDLNMPRMSGIEFLAEMRRDPRLRDSVVFVLTTSKAEEDKRQAYKYNVAGYIRKSRTSESIREAIRLINLYWTIVELPDHMTRASSPAVISSTSR